MTFLIHNPKRFSTDMLFWPGVVSFTKVFTAVGAQLAAIQAILQNRDELSTIKFFASAAVIGELDGKIIGIVTGLYEASSEGDIDSNPLEIGVF